VGSGNRSELRTGYFTKYGDGAADLLPLGCLYKTQVKQLAAHLGVPERIIKKVPSAGLWKGQTDEAELGLPYGKIDMIYAGLDLGLKPDKIAEAAGVRKEDVKKFKERERRSAHKIKGPEIPKLKSLRRH
jgi:NAD+ synthase